MASGTFYPAVSGDDGQWRTGGFGNSENYTQFGFAPAGRWNAFVRFPNVTIPLGAIITSAYIKLKAHYAESGTVTNARIYLNDVDNAVAPANEAQSDALVLTTNYSDWDNVAGWTAGNWYNSVDFTSAVHEVVNRAGWSSGNAVTVLIKDNVSDSGASRYASTVDYIAAAKAELHVEWILLTIDANVTNPSMTAQGYTGVTAVASSPSMTASGLTGIYSAPSIPIIQTEGFTGIHAEPSISMPTVILTGSDNMVHVESFVTLPSAIVEITQAEQIEGAITIPSMTADITERETTLGAATSPMMTAELSSGAHVDINATAPMTTAEGLFSGQVAITVPMPTAEIEGKIGRVVNSDVSIPMMTAGMTGKTEHLIDGAVSIPMTRVLADLMTGKIITGTAIIPMPTVALSGYEDIDGDIAVSIPMVEPYMVATTEREACEILRYSR